MDDPPENVVILDRKGTDIEVTSPFDTEKITTLEDAWYRIYKLTSYGQNSLPADIADKADWIFTAMLNKHGEIVSDTFTQILEIITDTMREAEALCAM